MFTCKFQFHGKGKVLCLIKKQIWCSECFFRARSLFYFIFVEHVIHLLLMQLYLEHAWVSQSSILCFTFSFFTYFMYVLKNLFSLHSFLAILLFIHTSHAYYLDFTLSVWSYCRYMFRGSFTINFSFHARSNMSPS
jgi:hypothetical protein